MPTHKIPVTAVHIAGWIFFQCLPLVFILSFSGNTSFWDIISSYSYWQFCICYIVLFYFHSYVLLPPFSVKKNWGWIYTPILLILMVAIVYLAPFDHLMHHSQTESFPTNRLAEPGMHGPPPNFTHSPGRIPPGGMRGPGRGRIRVDIISLFLFTIVIFFSIANNIVQRLRLTEQRAVRAEADKANAELSFLKAQINPHFLFNTLNNIYSMVVTKNEHTADSLLKLSNILRYVIDDSKEDYVSLQSEVDCISDYIDLQRLRLGKKVVLDYQVSGDLENKKIAPLILMTFIENVFKYGTSNHEESNLIIRLNVEETGILFFSQNKLFAIPRTPERSGIGISNTEKRLAHLYPGKYQLDIKQGNGLFTVDLFLQA